MNINYLKKLGFSDKTAKVYLGLLLLGPSSVRTLAAHVEYNRGTTYDALKWLQEEGVVSFFKKDSKQHFVAENPEMLHAIVKKRQSELSRVEQSVEKHIPELLALYNAGGGRPVARYYDSNSIHLILEDVLDVCEQDEESLYRIYSAEGVREYLYDNFPTFSDVRITKGISVKVIAVGKGGELRGLDERKWLQANTQTPTYILMYPGKTAYISLNAAEKPIGVVIENEGVYETQKAIFDSLWETV
ncbi:MAG: transcriptional regulator [Candidatus Magasanikbacteria bacterium]|nr:transcriptional regulator [Candidatus Magasanikbacteria bacterium]|tara:strand:+ start:4114 stop:4848 length:735 start_codon:yes stop_codon:yes gene_type:complete